MGLRRLLWEDGPPTLISKEELPKLFGKLFERGEKARKVFATGKGIGLFISSRIIKAHNGEVWAESEGKGKGSTFFVDLPIGEGK